MTPSLILEVRRRNSRVVYRILTCFRIAYLRNMLCGLFVHCVQLPIASVSHDGVGVDALN